MFRLQVLFLDFLYTTTSCDELHRSLFTAAEREIDNYLLMVIAKFRIFKSVHRVSRD